jgi:hypothetical protein
MHCRPELHLALSGNAASLTPPLGGTAASVALFLFSQYNKAISITMLTPRPREIRIAGQPKLFS